MKVEYFCINIFCHGIEKLLSVKCLDGFVLCIQG